MKQLKSLQPRKIFELFNWLVWGWVGGLAWKWRKKKFYNWWAGCFSCISIIIPYYKFRLGEKRRIKNFNSNVPITTTTIKNQNNCTLWINTKRASTQFLSFAPLVSPNLLFVSNNFPDECKLGYMNRKLSILKWSDLRL